MYKRKAAPRQGPLRYCTQVDMFPSAIKHSAQTLLLSRAFQKVLSRSSRPINSRQGCCALPSTPCASRADPSRRCQWQKVDMVGIGVTPLFVKSGRGRPYNIGYSAARKRTPSLASKSIEMEGPILVMCNGEQFVARRKFYIFCSPYRSNDIGRTLRGSVLNLHMTPYGT